MKRCILVCGVWMWQIGAVCAAVAQAEQLLPAETLAVLTVPDWGRALSVFTNSPQGKLWADPALRPFRESFIKRFSAQVLAPLEKELDFRFVDFLELARGQISLALTPNGWDGKSDRKPGWLLLLDAGEKREELKIRLAELRKRWADGNKPIKIEKLRDVEFTTLMMNEVEMDCALEKAFPSALGTDEEVAAGQKKSTASAGPYMITLGQSDSLLIAGNHLKDVEHVLARQAGVAVPVLGAQAGFGAAHGALFRDAPAFCWVNFQLIYQVLFGIYGEPDKPGRRESPIGPRVDKVLAASGLSGLKTVGLKLAGATDGSFVELFLSSPESGRQGLFQALTPEAKEAGPPPFVPNDTIKFSRWRLNGQQAWTTIESMLTAIAPEMAGVLQMGFATVGKDKDPNFDLKKTLIGNLGDDVIFLEKWTRSNPAVPVKPPSLLTLIGSPSPEQLGQGLRASTSLLPLSAADATVQEREFLGRKIYSVPLPADGSPGDRQPVPRRFHFSATVGYLGASTDADLLEDYVRGGGASGRGLRETQGLAEAARKVGGMATGYFGYENHHESMRVSFETLRNDSAALDRLLAANPVAGKPAAEEAQRFKGWFDFSLLPPFDNVAHYFHFVVYSFSTSGEGMSWKLFAPTPPSLKK